MPLFVKIFDPPITNIGNVAVIGADNQPFRGSIGCSFNYAINESDYFAGTLQFVTIFQLSLSLGIASRWIQFRDSNPRRYGLGEWSLTNGSNVLESGDISYLSQSISRYSRIISLSRNEAARQKLSTLSSRPRLLISKSATENMELNGSFLPTGGQWNGSGNVIGATPGVINIVGGFAGLTGAGTDAVAEFPRRQMVFDSTDGRIETTVLPAPDLSYPGSQINSLADIIEFRALNIFLEPGITGTIKCTVFKTGESEASHINPYPIYAAGNLPQV